MYKAARKKAENTKHDLSYTSATTRHFTLLCKWRNKTINPYHYIIWLVYWWDWILYCCCINQSVKESINYVTLRYAVLCCISVLSYCVFLFSFAVVCCRLSRWEHIPLLFYSFLFVSIFVFVLAALAEGIFFGNRRSSLTDPQLNTSSTLKTQQLQRYHTKYCTSLQLTYLHPVR